MRGRRGSREGSRDVQLSWWGGEGGGGEENKKDRRESGHPSDLCGKEA